MASSSLYIKKGTKNLLLLGVVSCMSLIIGGVVFFQQYARENGWKKSNGLDRIMITNISPHGFDVAWSTKEPVKDVQWVEWGTQADMFIAKQNAEYMNGLYYVPVRGLSANTTYHFRVRKGIETYVLGSLTNTTIKTPLEVKEKPVSPAYGKVMLPSGKPYANGLLVYDIDGFYPLGVFTKETGEWLLPLTGIVEKKTNTIRSIADSMQVSLKLFSFPDGNVRTTVVQTRPLRQAITAGISLRLTAQSTTNGTVLGEATRGDLPQVKGQPRIIYPKENAIIPGNAPLIKGIAVASQDVLVLIQGPTKQYSYRTKSDEKGDWLVKYPLALEAGRYTIAASTVDASGFPLTLRRSFSIIKSGEQVLGTATGSPTLIPTAPVVPTYASPTAAPTTALSPTLAPTIATYPTAVVPTRFIPTATPPITGGGMSAYAFAALFCIVVGAGLVLAF